MQEVFAGFGDMKIAPDVPGGRAHDELTAFEPETFHGQLAIGLTVFGKARKKPIRLVLDFRRKGFAILEEGFDHRSVLPLPVANVDEYFPCSL
jgi:hypothetical protein